jgi:phospholipid transport system transporter-binding protein
VHPVSPSPSGVAAGAVHRLPASVVYATASAELAGCARALAEGAQVFDLSACADFDSSLIALLLELRRQAAPRGFVPRLEGAPARLRGLAALYGVDGLLFPAP